VDFTRIIPPSNKEAKMPDDEDDGLDGDNSKTCERCRFFRELEIGKGGECRKYAPQPTRMRHGPRRQPDDHYRPEWPEVFVFDWCGDFEAARESWSDD
jgi:hypothetical protein